jgi:hypothetical protein
MSENSKATSSIISFILSDEMLNGKITLDTVSQEHLNAFDILVEFPSPISAFRNHDYTWVAISQDRIANDFSPKAIRLQNGWYVQANCNLGIWEVNAKNPKQLLWRFNPEFAAPITQYCNENNTKKIVSAQSDFDFPEKLALLISSEGIVELSRSPIPFSAIACFTDHCDFDTAENLKIQREFFKEKGIKITKGFFLNDFSKREDNASFENNASEIEQWRQDGHELCYHSLTQSIRNDEKAFAEFQNFIPPYPNIPVWIDHGYQPYNFSLFQKNGVSNDQYEATLLNKNIAVLWNYIDAGTATSGVLNQLDSSPFNLEKYYASIKGNSFLRRMVSLLKNIIFHYDNDELRVRNYIDTVSSTKALLVKKDWSAIFKLLKNAIPLVLLSLRVLFAWNLAKKTTYKVAKYSPIFFKHTIDKKEFTIFQTIELVDFISALSSKNIDALVEASGLFIAHTYFSVNTNNYEGKLINSDNSLNEKVVANFNYLAQKIEQKAIWNPTLSQLLEFYTKYQNIVLDIDTNGTIFIKNNYDIPSRSIT